MTTNLDVKKIEIEFPERILSKYYFEGHDLKSDTIKPQILLDAIEFYASVVLKDLKKSEMNKNTKDIEEFNKKYRELLVAKEQVNLLIQSEIEKKENFFIRSNTGEKIEINYLDSWEYKDYMCDKTIREIKRINLFVKSFPKIYKFMYSRFFAHNVRRIMKSSNYKKYQSEMDVKEQKILAYKMLNEVSKIYADKTMVEVFATILNIEIVKSSDFESEWFAKMKL